MNKDLTPFEKKLKSLQPQPLSKELESRIMGNILAEKASKTRYYRPIIGALVAAAILLMGVGLWFINVKSNPSPKSPLMAYEGVAVLDSFAGGAELQPIHAKNTLLGRVDEGVIFLNNGISARRYRYQFIDTVTWEDPADGARISMEIPREEIVLVPVQTF